ncbi:MAG: sigma-E processing peptidase SpoIIGA [Ruminococcus sp.]|nr:sigma-E processing peptidase SpoIIGA [Ruminococcus sp.]
MKTVYIDVLITVNIFIDFILLLCTQKLLNIRARMLRVILGSVAGGLCSLAALFPSLPFGLNIMSDLLFAAVIILTAFGFGRAKLFIRRVAVFFALSFSFCGLMLFIYHAFHPAGMEIYNDTVYFNISPLLLIILTLVSYYATKLYRRLTKGSCGQHACRIELAINHCSTSFPAVIDTGCKVKEPFSGDYVIIAEETILHDLRFQNVTMRIIPFESLGGEGILRGYKADEVKIDGKEVEQGVYLGVCDNVLKGELKALVPYALIERM